MRPTRRSTFDVAPIARIAMLARALMAVALGAAIGLPPVNGAARKEATAPPMKAATAVRLEGSWNVRWEAGRACLGESTGAHRF